MGDIRTRSSAYSRHLTSESCRAMPGMLPERPELLCQLVDVDVERVGLRTASLPHSTTLLEERSPAITNFDCTSTVSIHGLYTSNVFHQCQFVIICIVTHHAKQSRKLFLNQQNM